MTKRNQQSFYRRLGRIIRFRREAAGFSQERLGIAVGLTRTSICNIECGRQKPLIDSLIDIAEATNCGAFEILACCEKPYAK